jgi:hypothetical protein
MLIGLLDELPWQVWLVLFLFGLAWMAEKAVKSPTVQRGAASWFFGLFK